MKFADHQILTIIPLLVQILKINMERGLHPTQKPLALMEYLVKTYTNEGDIVLDNTMGSGTTNLACIKLNRKSIGIEKEKQYYDVAVRRASQYCH
jgi:site-specific DNA-methyltransferase (adenine-specific)